VVPHQLFGRKGRDLTLTLPVTYPEAALGADVKVPTLDGGTVTLKIPAGTQAGKTFRIRGKGGGLNGDKAGDMLVTVNVVVPQKLTKEARHLLEQFAGVQPDTPREHLGRRGAEAMAIQSHGPRDQGQRQAPQSPSTYEERAVYVISVAADLAGVHPQTLRIYERKGLLSPQRTAGNTRRYSERDVEQLRQIQRLTQDEGGQSRRGPHHHGHAAPPRRSPGAARPGPPPHGRSGASGGAPAGGPLGPRRPHWGVLARLDDVRQIFGQGG